MGNKCRFYKDCKLYSLDSVTCNENEGKYTEERMSGCYKVMEMEEYENK